MKPGPKLPKGEAIRRTKLSLIGMYPQGVALISRKINRELDKPPAEDVVTEDAWNVVHMVDGKPRQQVDANIQGQITLTDQLRALSTEELEALRALAKAQKGKAG